VTSTTFKKDGDDPFKLSSPQERLLSPLPDSSVISELPADEEETRETTDTIFPGVADLVATPESKGRRDSESTERENMEAPQTEVAPNAQSQSSDKVVRTPLRERGLSAGSNMVLSAPSESPASSPGGELTGDVTGDVRDLSYLVHEDENRPHLANTGRCSSISLPGKSPPSGWKFYQKFKEEEAGQNAGTSEVQEVAKLPRRFFAEAQSPTVDALVQALDKAPKNNESDRDDDFEIPEGRKSFAEQVPVYDEAEAKLHTSADAHGEGGFDPGMSPEMSSTSVLETSAHCPSAHSPRPSSVGTVDFEAFDRGFDQRVGRLPSNSPQVPRQGLTSGTGGTNSSSHNPYKAPGLAVLASIGNAALPDKKLNVVISRSPPEVGSARSRSPLSSGRFPTRSPPQDFAAWANVRSPKFEQSPRDSESGLLPGKSSMHPISQLTGHFDHECPGLSGTRTRMCWEEFINNCGITLYTNQRAQDHAVAPPLENSSNIYGTTFTCARSQILYESQQHDRAEYLQAFVHDIAAHADKKRSEYSVATQMWDRSTELPRIVHELLRVMSQRTLSPSDYEIFCTKVKDWFQHCKSEAWLQWYAHKRQWLEGDLDLVRKHSQVLREDTQRAHEATRRCRTILHEIRENFRRVQHTGELHELRQGYAALKYDMSRRNQEDRQLQKEKVPDAQVTLEAVRRKNSELEDRIRELQQRIQQEELSAKEASRAAMQHRLKRNILERERFARTCIFWKATAQAVCLKFRGNVHLWVERASSDFVRVSTAPPPLAASKEPPCFIQLAPELARGLLACAWSRTLATTSECDVYACLDKCLSEVDLSKPFEAQIPSHEVARFVRYFDVEVLQLIDKLNELRNLRKEIPEVSQVVAEFQRVDGTLPMLALSITVAVLRSHTVSADGVLRPLAIAADDDEVDAVQCMIRANEDLTASCEPKWSSVTVKTTVGRVEKDFVEQSLQRVAQNGSLRELVASAVQAMRRTVPFA
jgi:hypothetical protein